VKFIGKITEARRVELVSLRSLVIVDGMMHLLWELVPAFVGLAAFVIHTYMLGKEMMMMMLLMMMMTTSIRMMMIMMMTTLMRMRIMTMLMRMMVDIVMPMMRMMIVRIAKMMLMFLFSMPFHQPSPSQRLV